MLNKSKKIMAVDVHFEKRKTREYVGRLQRENNSYVFTYHDAYLFRRKALRLGPDLPMTQKKFISEELFPTFEDRIPSKRNPAYPEYCEMVGIDPEEKDLLTLVATLGHRGPSSFIFSPAPALAITHEEVAKFRKDLKLTIREFSELFDFAPATINKIERNLIAGKDALKRLEIYCCFPEAALFEVQRNRAKIIEKRAEYVEKFLQEKIKN